MNKAIVVVGALSAMLLAACGRIETGDVGVRVNFDGQVNKQEVLPGFYTAIVSSVYKFSGKESAIDLDNLTPKAKDNLSLKDLDVTFFYRVRPDAIAEQYIKYNGQHHKVDGHWLASYGLVAREARNATYEEVARWDSLIMHTKREEMAASIKHRLQVKLDDSDKGVFEVTKVIVRSLLTDQSIEASIQNAVQQQKLLEQKSIAVQVAAKDAEIRIAEAIGIAKANAIINSSLTREYLQHERNEVLREFARKGGSNTVVLDAGSAAPLLNIGK